MCIYQDIANRWLTNGKPLKNDRMYFIDDVLYSYGRHYPLARIDRAQNIVLINNVQSSITTNRHKQIVRTASISKVGIGRVFNVPQPLASLETNLQILRDNLQSAIDTANRRMIKPNIQAVEELYADFCILHSYMKASDAIDVFAQTNTLLAAYKAKRG